MGGAELRLGRLFDRESGRAFIVAFDHGTNLRVPPEAGRPLEVVENIVAGEPDGVLALGQAAAAGRLPERRVCPHRAGFPGGAAVRRAFPRGPYRGQDFSPAGLIGSILGAIVALLIWRWFVARRGTTAGGM